MFWYCVVVVFRALWLLLVALLMVVLVATMLSAACQQAGGQGLPEGAFGREVGQVVGNTMRALLNSLPPTYAD